MAETEQKTTPRAEDKAEVPTKPATRPSASAADVAKDAEKARAALKSARDSLAESKEADKPGDKTGAGVPLVSDEERAKRDERLRMADDGSRLEQRPLTHPGIKSGRPLRDDYNVEEELRQQWPGLFDDEDEDE